MYEDEHRRIIEVLSLCNVHSKLLFEAWDPCTVRGPSEFSLQAPPGQKKLPLFGPEFVLMNFFGPQHHQPWTRYIKSPDQDTIANSLSSGTNIERVAAVVGAQMNCKLKAFFLKFVVGSIN